MHKTLKRLLTILMLVGTLAATAAAQNEKRMAEINARLDETNRQIAESNADGEYSSMYLAETTVNKNNGQYPAVGVFRTVYRFFYTYGDREKNPYPNRLVKVEIETRRSDRTEIYEYLLDDAGQLVFYYEKKDEIEFRIYLFGEKPFKFFSTAKNVKINEKDGDREAKRALAEKRKLAAIFNESLDY